jgi:excisionase family DNA binding protein
VTTTISDLLTRNQAAEYLGVSPNTLAVWASTGRYPLPFVRVGRSVRYRRSDLEKFLESRTVTHTGEGH